MDNDFFSRHSKIMMQFSAGKDSAACLWMLEPFWDRIDFVWVNQGNPYPETEQYMLGIAETVPHFKMIMGNSKEWIKQNGHPVDVMPIESTPAGHILGRNEMKLSWFYECCGANCWQPMIDIINQNGYTGIIRGQRDTDFLQGPRRSGEIFEGIEYLFPIKSWTTKQVFDYLGDRVPPSYLRGHESSLDCMNCTAYLRETQGRLADLKNINTETYEEVKKVHLYLRKKCDEYSSLLEVKD